MSSEPTDKPLEESSVDAPLEKPGTNYLHLLSTVNKETGETVYWFGVLRKDNGRRYRRSDEKLLNRFFTEEEIDFHNIDVKRGEELEPKIPCLFEKKTEGLFENQEEVEFGEFGEGAEEFEEFEEFGGEDVWKYQLKSLGILSDQMNLTIERPLLKRS